MDIQTYMQRHELTQAEFGEIVGVSGGMVGHWLNGRNRITAERARDIEAKTRGEICAADLRPDIFGERDAA